MIFTSRSSRNKTLCVRFVDGEEEYFIYCMKAGYPIAVEPIPIIEGKQFKGWTLEEGSETHIEFPFMPTGDMTIYADAYIRDGYGNGNYVSGKLNSAHAEVIPITPVSGYGTEDSRITASLYSATAVVNQIMGVSARVQESSISAKAYSITSSIDSTESIANRSIAGTVTASLYGAAMSIEKG